MSAPHDGAVRQLRWLQRALVRGHLALATSTALICSMVTQHPLMVLVLLLGFPALLVAQELVEQRLREITRSGQQATRTAETASSVAGRELLILEQAQLDSGSAQRESTTPESPFDRRHSLPRGVPAVAERRDSTSSSTAAA